MKRLVYLWIGAAAALALPGCAANRSFAPADPFLPRPSAPAEPRKSLGDPLEDLGGGPTSLPSRGRGPVLGHPEARRAPQTPPNEQLAGRLPSSEALPPTPWKTRSAAPRSRNAKADRLQFLEEPTWSRFYRSTERRAIETMALGAGTRRVAVISSLHGDEAQSVALVEELARHLRAHPKTCPNTTLLLVRCPNPDGAQARQPYNARGVDLNRNFPAANWKELPRGRSGSKAASEVETQILMRLLADLQPTLLVHVKEARDAAAVNHEGQHLERRAREVALLTGCEPVGGLGQKTSGSVEAYAMDKLSCPSLTLLLPQQDGQATAAARYLDALLLALEPLDTEGATAPRDADNLANQRPDPFEEPSARPSSMTKVRAGTPPASRARPAEPIPDRGYFELPEP